LKIDVVDRIDFIDDIDNWLNDYLKLTRDDEPYIISLEPIIEDITKTENLNEMKEKMNALERRFNEGEGLLNFIKKSILHLFCLELNNAISMNGKERMQNRVIKLFGFDIS
jgi:hypothetical protein